MSGHSRWSQIKRKKGKADVERGKLFSKILREITVAARNGGGDSKVNMRLKSAIEAAREANMPQDTSSGPSRRVPASCRGSPTRRSPTRGMPRAAWP
jgi:hypothetical protein